MLNAVLFKDEELSMIKIQYASKELISSFYETLSKVAEVVF